MRDQSITKIYHSTGEVSKIIKETPATIRQWERHFNFFRSNRKNSRRKYTIKNIEVFRKIQHLLRVENESWESAKKILEEELKCKT